MTQTADTYLNAGGDPEIPRDRFGRPLVKPLTGGEPVPYTRCTTFVDCLEDKYNLQKWMQRMVALGLSTRPDLQLRATSLGVVEPDDPGEARRWKGDLDQVCEAASEAAKSRASATIGTSLHALTEKIDRGQDVGFVPEQYRPHLRAYEKATVSFTAHHIERFAVLDELQVGGTPDRIVSVQGHDGLFIADVKTGSVEFGTGKMAMQLAVYSRSLMYDFATGVRTSPGPVDQTKGIIIALDAKTGECRVLWIDLAAGWRGVQLAEQVRTWRRGSRGLTKPMLVAQPGDGLIDVSTGEILPDGDRDGDTYSHDEDYARLNGQAQQVFACLLNGQWWTLAELSRKSGGSEAGVSARLRDLRKERFGGRTIARRHLGDGLHEYRLVMGGEPEFDKPASFPLTTPEVTAALAIADKRDPATLAALKVAITNAATPDELIELWRAAGAAWTPEHTAAAAARKKELAA